MASFRTAAANADFSKVQDFYLILTNQPGAASWPISAATYMLMCTDYPAEKNKGVLHARPSLPAPPRKNPAALPLPGSE